MSTRRFDGPTPEAALAAARAALGEVKVVSATKVRHGGVAGFFARERVELEVEAPDGAVERAVAPAVPVEDPGNPGLAGGGFDGPVVSDEDLSALLEGMLAAPPRSVLEMTAGIDDAEALTLSAPAVPTPAADTPAMAACPARGKLLRYSSAPAEPARVSTQRPGFAAVLDRIAREAAGPAPLSPEAPAAPVLAPADLLAAAAESAPAAVAEPVVAGAAGLVAYSPTGKSAAQPAVPPPVTTFAPGGDATAILPAVAVAVAAGGNAHAVVPAAGDLPALSGTGGWPSALERIGLGPAAVTAALGVGDTGSGNDDADLACSLLARILDGLRPAPSLPSGPGSVLAVVGPAATADATARALAGAMGVDASDIVFVARRAGSRNLPPPLTSPGAAAEARRSWRWRPGPTVVAVHCDGRPENSAWARTMLAALEPALCVGAVAAHRKPEDIARWSDRIGGLDALAVSDLAGTASPAAVLGSGIPVAWIDGRPATAETWSEALTPLLAA